MIHKSKQTYLEYIKSNVDCINNHNTPSYGWKLNRFNKPLKIIIDAENDYPDFANALSAIDKDRLTREDVSKCYKKDLYYGFIATLLWGGYHKGRYNKGKDGRFVTILKIKKETIVERINRVKSLLLADNVVEAFNSMLKGENHINGIGLSYITKVLYFLSYDSEMEIKPLIFDSIAKKIHCAIMIDKPEDCVNEWYYYRGKDLCCKKHHDEMYIKYLRDMCELSNSYGISSADKLEEALFGKPYCKSIDNPRTVVCAYLKRSKSSMTK